VGGHNIVICHIHSSRFSPPSFHSHFVFINFFIYIYLLQNAKVSLECVREKGEDNIWRKFCFPMDDGSGCLNRITHLLIEINENWDNRVIFHFQFYTRVDVDKWNVSGAIRSVIIICCLFINENLTHVDEPTHYPHIN